MRRLAIIPVLDDLAAAVKKNHPNNTLVVNINHAFNAKLFDEVIVVSKDEAVLRLAGLYGANVFLWTSEDSQSFTGDLIEILVTVVEKFKQKGIQIDYGCCILPDALVAAAPILNEAFEQLISEKLDSVVSVTPYRYPIEKALKIQNNKLVMLHPEFAEMDVDELNPAYYDLKQFYFFNTCALLKYKRLLTKKTGAIILTDEQIDAFQQKSIEWNLQMRDLNIIQLNHAESLRHKLFI